MTEGRRGKSRMVTGRKFLATVGTLVCVAPLLVGCGGPTTKAEVCKDFDDMGQQLLQGNGVIGNPVFTAVKKAGDTASRYEDDAGVQSDGEALKAIGKSDSLSGNDVLNSSMNIANLCGHPAIFGG